MTEGLAWPPTKEDLERLYLVQKLSAAKIAGVYGLKYKSQKVAESTVLYHLKRNGINRRDPAAHVRKVTDEMVDRWVLRYESGESLKQIAGKELSPVTVFLHLRRRGVQLRGKVDAQILRMTKHTRRPFRGEGLEKAYLIGLRYGDLDAVRHGRAIRVRVSTTHPAMADLFDSLFSPYGFVHWYPRSAVLTRFEWSLECDLDASFEFLLRKPSIDDLQGFSDEEFLSFLAGFFDAEGSVFLHRKSSGRAPELNIANTEKEVLDLIHRRLSCLGIISKLTVWDQRTKRSQFVSVRPLWRLSIWRFDCVKRLLSKLALRHAEKIAKRQIALSFVAPVSRPANAEASGEWDSLTQRIDQERLKFIERAGQELEGVE